MDFSFKAIPTAPNPAQLDLHMDANPANAVPVNSGFGFPSDEYSVRPMNADWNATTGPAYILNKPNPYVLPIASATVLGGVKIGTGLSIDVNGVLSAAAAVSQPATQIVFGTGTGLNSVSTFVYNNGQVGIGIASFLGTEKLRVGGDTVLTGVLYVTNANNPGSQFSAITHYDAGGGGTSFPRALFNIGNSSNNPANAGFYATPNVLNTNNSVFWGLSTMPNVKGAGSRQVLIQEDANGDVSFYTTVAENPSSAAVNWYLGGTASGSIGNPALAVNTSLQVGVGVATFIGTEKLRVNGDIYIDKSIRIGSQTLDPTSPANGLIYYNSTSNKFKGYRNGAMLDFYMKGDVNGGTIIWVDKTNANATDTRTGLSKYSYDVPFLTVQAATSASASGDIIQVMGGTYAEDVVLPITYISSGQATFHFYNSYVRSITVSGAGPVIHVTVRGFGPQAQLDTLTGHTNGASILIVDSIILKKAVNMAATTSFFRDLTINTDAATNLWRANYLRCTITCAGNAISATYGLEGGATFKDCVITAVGNFCPQTGGLMATTGVVLFERCNISVTGNMFSSRAGTIRVKNSYLKCGTGAGNYLFNNDSVAQAAVTVMIHDSYLFTGGVIFTTNVGGTTTEYGNVIRNTANVNMPAGAVTFGYDVLATGVTYF